VAEEKKVVDTYREKKKNLTWLLLQYKIFYIR